MEFLKSTSFARKQLLLGLGLAGISVVVVTVALDCSHSHMIGSANYLEIESSMDLVADILPPPAYLIELYLVSKELVESEDREERRELVARSSILRNEYNSRRDHWAAHLPEDHVKQTFNESVACGLEFIRTLELEFLPLIESGRVDDASLVLNKKLTPLFREHRTKIRNAVPLALEKRRTIADRAVQESSYFSDVATLYSLSLIAVAFGLYWRFGQSLKKRILALQASATSIASGNLSEDTLDTAGDEIGRTSRSYHAVKLSLAMLTEEIQHLVQAAKHGDLSVRVDPKKYQGVFSEVVDGLNKMLEAISAPLNEAVSVLSLVAERNLTGQVQGEYAGQFDFLKTSLNEALSELNDLLCGISEDADLVGAAANGIADDSQSLADRAVAQASTLTSISQSMDQIASATVQSATNNQVCHQLANESKSMVDEGTQVMQSMTSAISKIRETAESSALIVKTIDDIAFQTGMLALNAAVEAARAGEAGQGFEVVAGEFRNLARQSADAARLTAKMIENAVENADNGVQITIKMGEILNEIRDRATKVNERMSEIALASQEQSREIEHVNCAISDLQELTNQTAEASIKSSQSADNLNSQASSLNRSLSAFTLTDARHETDYRRADQIRTELANAH